MLQRGVMRMVSRWGVAWCNCVGSTSRTWVYKFLVLFSNQFCCVGRNGTVEGIRDACGFVRHCVAHCGVARSVCRGLTAGGTGGSGAHIFNFDDTSVCFSFS